MRPLPYKFSNSAVVLGHYKVAQRSGSIAATIGALGHLASIRWAPTTQTNANLVLTRLRCGITVDGAITTATEMTLRAIIARNFTVEFTTASTAISLVAGANRMDSGRMATSLMGATGPRISTTTVMSGQTFAADAAPFAMATLPCLTPTNSTGTAVAVPVGFATPMVTLYEWTGLGDHPPTLNNAEGIIVQPVVAGPASGTFALYTEWSWAEVINPFGN